MSGRTVTVRWRSEGGLEHCVVRVADTGITAEGVVIGGRDDAGYGLRYRITIDPDWSAFRSLHLTLLGGPTLALRHDGYGQWTDGEGKVRKDFAGVLDVDIAATPLALTATLRRLPWKAGRSQTIDVLTVGVPALTAAREQRTIACVEPGAAFRIGDAEIRLGDDGLPVAWTGRVEPAAA